tara:strand:+ start:640 stop:915 length:276 start_codon:yes stop_codon:yes gene_type:complete
MGAMAYIHYLCEKENLKELTEELGNGDMAKQFIEAHKIMRLNRGNKEYEQLNEITDKAIEEYEKDPAQGKLNSKKVVAELSEMAKDIDRMT